MPFLDSLKEVDGFILKRGSPSSGFKNFKIYPKIEVQVYSFAGRSYLERAIETNLAEYLRW